MSEDANGWRPIKSAPSGPVLLYVPSARPEKRLSVGHRIGDDGGLWIIGGRFYFDVGEPTHWSPLPAPPVT